MTIGSTPPNARGSPARVEVVHRSQRSQVVRVVRADGTVIRKEPFGPGADRRLRHEVAVLERLSGVTGVAQLARVPGPAGAITMEDAGPASLADVTTPVRPGELGRLALDLARAVAGMHGRGVLHRDINPGNIVLSGAERTPRLVDFSLASTFAELRPEFLHHSEIAGELAYLAPEQTGRTGRPVDQRADLYALGATLYELATGAPPFGTGDPLQLIHDHFAREPVPPIEVNPAVPQALSDVILHLLAKEPDNRYQTAQGLIHDLVQIQAGAAVRVGTHDFPQRLLAPSRLVGRGPQLAALESAFAGALAGDCHGLVVSGAPGVGKTTLINELRPMVTAARGWFVSGKFDQYRRDLDADAVHQAFRVLGRLLLAEPTDELDELRDQLLRELGDNAGLTVAITPEFAPLLQVPAELGDPASIDVRMELNAVTILRAVASRDRPIVLVVDDLQWATRTPLGLVDALLSGDEKIEGLLLVVAYRAGEITAGHPLTAMLSRWSNNSVERLRLDNLSPAEVTTMVADILRLDAFDATPLAGPVAARTGGNPYDTVELLNALRHDGVLVPGSDGWRWDEDALHRSIGRADLYASRVDGMPAATRELLESMACLAGRVEVGLLQAATGLSADAVEERLAPALADGMLVLEPGPQDEVLFRHDRVQAAILGRLKPDARAALRLRLARQLTVRPQLFAVAAEQYGPVVDTLREPEERQRVAALLFRAAEQAQMVSNHALVESQLAAAARLVDPADVGMLMRVQTSRLNALVRLGRFDEADDLFRTIDALSTDPTQRTGAVLAKVSSLTNRNRPREALALGIDQMERLGHPTPAPEQLHQQISRGLDRLYRWVENGDAEDDLGRPEVTDPYLLDLAALINRLTPAAFFCDQAMFAWLGLEALRMWDQHGPGATLLGPAANVGFITVALRRDYRTGYQAMLRIQAVSEQRRYEPYTSQARFLYALGTGHWFEPIEDNVAHAQRAREGLLHNGDLQTACHTYYVTLYELLDCAPTLTGYVADVDAGLTLARRTGDDHSLDAYRSFRWLASVLRGEPVEPEEDDGAYRARLAANPVAAACGHATRALAAALLDDAAGLERHVSALDPLLDAVASTYLTATGCVLRVLALGGRARAADAGPVRGRTLAELDTAIAWLAARAADAPENFGHLVLLAEAERAWAAGEFSTAARAYDTAMTDVGTRERPWHRALIIERAARFYLSRDLEYIGRHLLVQAAQEYQQWGAPAKVDQLHQAQPGLAIEPFATAQASAEAPHSSGIMTGTIDLLGILAASQALSSETSLDRLCTRVIEVLGAMTGATGVRLALRGDDEAPWHLYQPESYTPDTIPVDEAERERLVPLSVLRYAARTREPLVIEDATRDDRFARDPYLQGFETASLVAVPIINRGRLSAMLVLENRLIRGAFSADRLDGVELIAGQLAVSLDNALIYASLERKVAERTQQLAIANERLEQLSVTDPLTGLANRRRLQEVLDQEWSRSQRTAQPIGLAMLDVDHFKSYNDRYGHLSGDECLQRIADELRRITRGTELVARYGGEEFAVVLPSFDIAAAATLAERLRRAIVALRIPHSMGPDRIVTISVGVAAIVAPADGAVEHLIQLADVELYRAKRTGRNRVEVATQAA